MTVTPPKMPKQRAKFQNPYKAKGDKKEPSTVAVTVRLPVALRTKLLRIANADGRTLNNWITKQLQDNSQG